jgi:hypothetical protein
MRPSKHFADESGSASVEFVTVGLLLLVPLVYLVLAVASIQAAALAVEAASRQAARVFVQSAAIDDARDATIRAVSFALADHGLDPGAATITVECSPNPDSCLTRRGFVEVGVSIEVALPLAPPFLQGAFPLSVPLSAAATQQVSRFWGAG